MVTGLDNGTDYRLRLTAVCAGRSVKAPARLFRCGHFPGTVINYIHPDDHTYMPSGRSPASRSLLRLPSGRLLASHDIFWGVCDQNLSFVFASDDNGVSWQYLSRIHPCFWGKLFLHGGSIYMLGMSTEYGALQIFRSEDGISWSEPSELMPGGGRDRGGPHKAPMPVEKVGFQYVDWIFDNPDIVALSRTALNGAWNHHNANALTVHRIRNFRL